MATRHGHWTGDKGSPTYKSWNAMKNRCDNPKAKNFKYWGGKGITYDPAWGDFVAFLADMGERPTGLTLDRVDSAKNYDKSNCRWATSKVQNRHQQHLIEHDGKTLSIRDWAAFAGLKERTLWMRLFDRGWPIAKALSTPVN